MKISIVSPLFDRRNAGWKALESALNQDFPRERFEVIAVLGTDADAIARDIAPLLARCDHVVRTDLDPDDEANEARFYRAGCEPASGDVLFFVEGHTVLDARACAIIDTHFRLHPETAIAIAPRLYHDETPLGSLITMHNLRHEERVAARGGFSLGANSVIRRSLLDRIGGIDTRFLRFSETAVFDHAMREGIPIGRIQEPLATHYDDMAAALWRKLVTGAGAGKFAYYRACLDRGENLRATVRHPVYLLIDRTWRARALHPLFRAASAALLPLALAALRIDRRLAYRIYVLALGCTDLSGYCQAWLRSGAEASASPPPC